MLTISLHSHQYWKKKSHFLWISKQIGLPYVTLLMNQLLALIDRYICISRSVWYRQSVTVRWVLTIQFICFVILCLLMKGPYIFGLAPLECRANPHDRKVFFAFILVFMVLCITGQIVVYLKTKTYLVIGETGNIEEGGTNQISTAKRQIEIALTVIHSRRSVADAIEPVSTTYTGTARRTQHSLNIHEGIFSYIIRI